MYQLQEESNLENFETFRQKIKMSEQEAESISNYHHLLNSAVTRIQ